MIDVFVQYEAGRATLEFIVNKKEWSVFFECQHRDHAEPAVYDFAAFACVIVADRFSEDVKLHAPVTQVALNNCRELANFLRITRGVHKSYEVHCDEIVCPEPASGQFKSLCISTGVDSTYVLVTEKENHQFTHGLVVHGADYPVTETEGFNALLGRVEKMCGKAGLEPIVVATNLRQIKYDWGMLHAARCSVGSMYAFSGGKVFRCSIFR